MNITYDPDADAAYISIVGAIAPGEAARQVSFVEAPGSESMVTLDFDANGYLLGVEISFRLPDASFGSAGSGGAAPSDLNCPFSSALPVMQPVS